MAGGAPGRRAAVAEAGLSAGRCGGSAEDGAGGAGAGAGDISSEGSLLMFGSGLPHEEGSRLCEGSRNLRNDENIGLQQSSAYAASCGNRSRLRQLRQQRGDAKSTRHGVTSLPCRGWIRWLTVSVDDAGREAKGRVGRAWKQLFRSQLGTDACLRRKRLRVASAKAATMTDQLQSTNQQPDVISL